MSEAYRQAGKVLAKLREARGLTQTALANALDITPAHVSRIETGNRRITLTLIERAARFFGVPPSVFLNGAVAPSDDRRTRGTKPRDVRLDDKGRARPCPNCGEDRYRDQARYCPKCGWALFNFCIAAERHVNEPSADRCDWCGKRTWWSFDSQAEIDRLGIPDDVRSSHSTGDAQETT